MAARIKINGEAIFATRPFKVYGEGVPDKVTTGSLNEGKGRSYKAADMRFTVDQTRLPTQH